MERIKPKLHKKFLTYLKLFLNKLFNKRGNIFNYLGLKLTVKGKISVTGNAKKRTYRIRTGVCSLSTKQHRISYSCGVVHTPTGVLGIKFFLFY